MRHLNGWICLLVLAVVTAASAPAATKENPRPRPSIKPGTFSILVPGP